VQGARNAKTRFGTLGTLAHQVGSIGVAELVFSGAGSFKPLFGTGVSLHFRHDNPFFFLPHFQSECKDREFPLEK
jgi:hypothetical protein